MDKNCSGHHCSIGNVLCGYEPTDCILSVDHLNAAEQLHTAHQVILRSHRYLTGRGMQTASSCRVEGQCGDSVAVQRNGDLASGNGRFFAALPFDESIFSMPAY